MKLTLNRIRRRILTLAGHSSHVAPALSLVEILWTLAFRFIPKAFQTDSSQDLLIFSKGHGCMALYAILAENGILSEEEMATYAMNGSPLGEHPISGAVPGIRWVGGSLGHGLPVACGVAKGWKLRGSPQQVVAVVGDGECDEGSVWEAAAVGPIHGLDNLTVMVDWNGMQACGPCSAISPHIDLPSIWRSFGWDVRVVDGHDVMALENTLRQSGPIGIPRVLFCRTVKGKGISFMEGDLEWHYRPVRGKDLETALQELVDA